MMPLLIDTSSSGVHVAKKRKNAVDQLRRQSENTIVLEVSRG